MKKEKKEKSGGLKKKFSKVEGLTSSTCAAEGELSETEALEENEKGRLHDLIDMSGSLHICSHHLTQRS